MYTDRKSAILDAFVNLVKRFGIDKTTMQDVAREVGISVGAIYKDFTNKDELIQVYINKMIQSITFDCYQVLEQDKDPKQMLHDLIITFIRKIGENVSRDRGFIQSLFGNLQIRQKKLQFDDVFDKELQVMVGKILEKGKNEGVFIVENIPETAEYFIIAFGVFPLKIVLVEEDLDELMEKVEKMFSFVIRAIEPEPGI